MVYFALTTNFFMNAECPSLYPNMPPASSLTCPECLNVQSQVFSFEIPICTQCCTHTKPILDANMQQQLCLATKTLTTLPTSQMMGTMKMRATTSTSAASFPGRCALICVWTFPEVFAATVRQDLG